MARPEAGNSDSGCALNLLALWMLSIMFILASISHDRICETVYDLDDLHKQLGLQRNVRGIERCESLQGFPLFVQSRESFYKNRSEHFRGPSNEKD